MIVYMILSIQMVVSIPWIHFYDLFYTDGCDHTMGSCVILFLVKHYVFRNIQSRDAIYCKMFDLVGFLKVVCVPCLGS